MTDTVESQPIHLHRRAAAASASAQGEWSRAAVLELLQSPFMALVHRAQAVHLQHFPVGDIELASLLSVKTGGCPEDCGYCPQSIHHPTGLPATKLMGEDEVMVAARHAKEAGASRFCMGAAWRSPTDRDVDKVADLIRAVHGLGLETCATLGMLEPTQAQTLADAGLDYYNHNLDSASDFYPEVIGTRVYQDRLDNIWRCVKFRK